jgi:hypothetical protein
MSDSAETSEAEDSTALVDAQSDNVSDVSDVIDGDALGAEPMTVSEPGDTAALSAMAAQLEVLVADSARYHQRAEKREKLIEDMRSELDRLRLGERRGLLRPLLTEMCRLRDDLLRQAEQLPQDFDAASASALLQGFAESVEIALADNGVNPYAPEVGDIFDPRAQRGISRQPSTDSAQVGKVAAIRRSGYFDIEANAPLAVAEVAVFVAAPAPPTQPEPAPAAEPVVPAAAPVQTASGPVGEATPTEPAPLPRIGRPSPYPDSPGEPASSVFGSTAIDPEG